MNSLPIFNPADYGIIAKLPEAFDHSFTGTFGECQRMALYQTIWGRRSKYALEYSLLWGGVFHDIADTWQKTQDVRAIAEIIEANIPEVVDDRYGRNRGRMQELLIAWLEFRKNEPITVLRSEQPATVICDHPCPYYPNEPKGCNLTYGGRLDNIVRWMSYVGPLDFKTTVMDESDPISQFRPSHQMGGYTWMTTHLMGEVCWGVIIERLVCNKSKIKIDRFPIPYSQDLVREWVETERLRHEEIRRKFAEHPYDEIHWTQNFGRCWQPYSCAYRDFCLSPREMNFRMRWIRDNTIEHRFDFRKMEGADAVPS